MKTLFQSVLLGLKCFYRLFYALLTHRVDLDLPCKHLSKKTRPHCFHSCMSKTRMIHQIFLGKLSKKELWLKPKGQVRKPCFHFISYAVFTSRSGNALLNLLFFQTKIGSSEHIWQILKSYLNLSFFLFWRSVSIWKIETTSTFVLEV